MEDDCTPGDQPSLVSAQPPVSTISAETPMTDFPGSGSGQTPVAADDADAGVLPIVDDSVSDVSMVAESDDENEDQSIFPLARNATPSESSHGATTNTPDLASKKRKSSNRTSIDSTDNNLVLTGPAKKVKLNTFDEEADRQSSGALPDRSSLPAEIWHHVFTFCPPRSLGNLLAVNKLFHSYLHPSSPIFAEYRKPLPTSTVHALKPGAIWRASRILFWPKMPTPLLDKSELDMWQLACSRPCQHCGKVVDEPPPQTPDPLRLGPGVEGVAAIWPFATRSCGMCLVQNSLKELDFLLSPSHPSSLKPALNFVLSTADLNMIPSSAVERAQSAQLSMAKFFWRPELDLLKEELHSAQEFGPAAVEEWLKGLEARGVRQGSAAARWEQFTISGGVGQMRTFLYPGYPLKSSLPSMPTAEPGEQPLKEPTASTIPSVTNAAPFVTTSTIPPAPGSKTNGTTLDGPGLPPHGLVEPRIERTKVEEITGLKATRMKDIELRAQTLDPPLVPSVLAHIPSFQAAIQIPKPLDDDAWQLLKPRLVAQRGDVEQREKERAAQLRLKAEPDEERNAEDAFKERAMVDEEWNEVQAPVRARLAAFADEIIRDAWDDGAKVTKEKTPKFAAEVLLYVRRRFYAEVAKDAAAARAAGTEPPSDPPQGPFTQKLTLENMKWIYDAKIKPHTEAHRKELFICNGQNCHGNARFYGFEGVIQHYAAKHTNLLSSGSIVVHWRAEWPEEPPFNPEGRIGRNVMYPTGNTATAFQTATPPHYGIGAYGPGPPALLQPPIQPFHGATPAPYNAPPYGEGYPPPPSASFAPTGYPSNATQFGPPSFQQPAAPYVAFPSGPSPGGPYPGPPTGPPQGYGAPPHLPAGPQSGPPAAGPPGAYNYNYGAFHANGQIGYAALPGGSYADQYPAQLFDMARNARDLWGSTATLRDALGSARVQTIIYHLAKRFRHRFSVEPPLTMFIDGLSNNKDMRPVRNINGLMCKACHLGLGNASSIGQDERKSFSLPQLVTHFQGKHIEPVLNTGQFGPPLDWTTDMVLLPDMATLSTLRSVVGGDQVKYHLVYEAIPEAFIDANAAALPVEYQAHPPDAAWQQKPESMDNYAKFYGAPQQVSSHSQSGHQQDPVGQYAQYPGSYAETVSHADYGDRPDDSQGSHDRGMPAENGAAPVFANSSNARFDAAERKSAQGNHSNHSKKEQNAQQGRHNHSKKKSGPKGRNNHGGQKRRGGSEEGEVADESRAVRTRRNEVNEAETKKAEEEQRRQEEEIKAMWAADRAKTAKGAPTTGGETAKSSKSQPKPMQSNTPTAQQQQAKSRTPQRFSRPKPSSVLPRQQPAREAERVPRPEPVQRQHEVKCEEPSLLDALEMHLDQGQPSHYPPVQQRPPRLQPSQEVYRETRQGQPQQEPQQEPQAKRVIYVDERHNMPPREPEPYHRFVDSRIDVTRGRSQSPAYVRYSQQPPAATYRERSPLPRYHESLHQDRAGRDRAGRVPVEEMGPDRVHSRQDEAEYERPGPPRQEFYRVYADDVARPPARPVEYEEYEEIIEVRDAQGAYFVRRPVRRIREPPHELPPPHEAVRYLGQPPAYDSDRRRYNDERRVYEDDEHVRAPPTYDAQQHQQPAYPREVGPPPQQRAQSVYTREQPPYPQEPSTYPREQPTYAREQPAYQREPSAYPREAGPSPSARIYAHPEPGMPAQPPRPISRSDPAYLEEYDPRFPAAAPPAAARPVRY